MLILTILSDKSIFHFSPPILDKMYNMHKSGKGCRPASTELVKDNGSSLCKEFWQHQGEPWDQMWPTNSLQKSQRTLGFRF